MFPRLTERNPRTALKRRDIADFEVFLVKRHHMIQIEGRPTAGLEQILEFRVDRWTNGKEVGFGAVF